MDAAFIKKLEEIVGPALVLSGVDDLRCYQYDGSIDKALPELVVIPETAEQIASIVQACNERGYPYLARGAGTGLSGGAIAELGGVVISTARLHRVLEIDVENRLAVVEPGVVNAEISAAVKQYGLQYIPDPSSMAACTIGGNVAENSGGLHCLAYGVTTNHTLGVEFVTADGEIQWLGGKTADPPGYDLLGAFVGSEGTLGIATKVVVRLTPLAETARTLMAVFDSVDDASQAVSDIIAGGVIPGALEMMDRLATEAVEAFAQAGFPTDAAAILIIEVDGLREAVDELTASVRNVCSRNRAREVRLARDAAERDRIWLGRKGAFGAMGRLSHSYYVQDGVIPRSRLPEVLREIGEIGTRYGLRIANVFHAGDGNLHPLILFDDKVPGEVDKAIAAGADILRACVQRGGSISGEHGIGMEKRDCMTLQFSSDDLALMARVKSAFNDRRLCNPLKVFPTSRRCGEAARKVDRGALAPEVAAAAGPAF
ncbi:MAG TPA: FAD-linked oxidase C-terminal domain-containing protein [Candidatus Tumulicola sp.]|nr:FAD-linked oxidase C-terminal domain-containing protein [Candidatus Tumulicola sp.]